MKNKDPHEYICIDAPPTEFGGFDDDDEDEDDEDEDDGADEQAHEKRDRDGSGEKKMWPKPANERPRWRWIMLWQSWSLLCDWVRRASYTDPDNFGMVILTSMTRVWHLR